NSVAQIARDRLQPCDPAHIAARFFHLLDAAELEARAAPCRLLPHTVPLILLSFALDVEAELIVELLLDGGAREERAQTIANVAQEFSEHDEGGRECLAAGRVGRRSPFHLRFYRSSEVCHPS